jgi:ubiquinone/menaquinone biosynthesis C-methylase UbiE
MNSDSPRELDQELLNLIIQGHAAFQLLWAGTRLGLFDLLSSDPGLTSEQLSNRLGLKSQPARILLAGLTALGILKKGDGRFSNADLTNRLLVRGFPGNLVDVLGWQHHIVYKGLVDFTEALQLGTNVGLRHFPGAEATLYQRLAHDKALEKVFQDAMSSLSSHANRHLTDHVDLRGVERLMDVGGGDGTNAAAFLNKYPDLRATIFDSASVCEIARENMTKQGLQDRISTHPGDLFATPFPDDVDAIMYCHMFTIWSAEKNRSIIQKTYDALPQGGKIIIFNMMGNDDDTGPISTALGSLYFLTIATGEGMLYSWRDYETWLKDSGFQSLRRIDGLPLDHGIFIAIK